MITLYFFTVAIITTMGFVIVLPSCLVPNEKGKWGFALLALIYCIYDRMMMSYTDTTPVSIKCLGFIAAYLISFLIIKFFFQGNSVKNYIWMYGASFLYQALASIAISVIFGVRCNFDPYEIERQGDIPSIENIILMTVAALLGAFSGRALTVMLLKRNNRMIQALISLLAAVGILGGAVNSAESLYIITPFLVLALALGMIHQDRRLREVEKQEKYYRQLEERQKIRQEELAKIRHDLANHIHVIQEAGSAGYAQEVLQSIDKEIKSGEPIIDCLLEEKEKLCAEKNIHIQEELISLSGSGIPNFDWVSLLANLLDNAIEACEKAGSEKKINLHIKRNRDYVVISMTNSKTIEDKPAENKFRTTKEQKQNHGYGTRIMKDIAEKYQGRIRYEDQGSQMMVCITMKAW